MLHLAHDIDMSVTLDPALLALLACPRCKGPLVYDAERSQLTCAVCAKAYAVKDGIPDLV